MSQVFLLSFKKIPFFLTYKATKTAFVSVEKIFFFLLYYRKIENNRFKSYQNISKYATILSWKSLVVNILEFIREMFDKYLALPLAEIWFSYLLFLQLRFNNAIIRLCKY